MDIPVGEKKERERELGTKKNTRFNIVIMLCIYSMEWLLYHIFKYILGIFTTRRRQKANIYML